MPSTNDCIRTALGAGQTNDLLLAYFQANGATSGDYQTAEREFLVARGQGTGHNQDRWYRYLRSLGYTGAYQDMWNSFWCGDAGAIPTGSAFSSGFSSGFA